jgi:hypothetical protein
MYGDKGLEWQVASRDTAATTTRALPLGQSDLPVGDDGTTKDLSPYGGLFIVAIAREDLAEDFQLKLMQSDTEAGTYDALKEFPALTAAVAANTVLIKEPLPFGARNWLKWSLSAAKKLDIFATRDVDRWVNGMIPLA